MIRLYIPAQLSQGHCVRLDEATRHYVVHVMRRKHGDTIHVFNQENGEWEALIQTDKRETILVIQKQRRQPLIKDSPRYHAVLSLIKPKNLELAIEKLTELGITDIHLVTTKRSNVRHTNLPRLMLIAKEAAEQCERLDIPKIYDSMPLEKWLDSQLKTLTISTLLVANERFSSPSLTLQNLMPGNLGFFIGPEGGLSDEDKRAVLSLPSAIPISLGSNILRAETAAIVCGTLMIFSSLKQ
jgi:16S rRNA (uracil1498-N3)-methyltransferase